MSLTDQHRIEIAADNCEVLRARLARYEDADGKPKAQPSGVVQWPGADEIMQMAFEEGQPSEDASGYYFELEEFDLFIQRLMEEVVRLNSSTDSAGDDRETIRAVFLRNGFTIKEGQADLKPYVYAAAGELMSIARAALSAPSHGGGVAHTDCRSEDGITVGLIDSIITSCRVLSSRDLTCEAAVEALRDLRSDSDVSLIKPSQGGESVAWHTEDHLTDKSATTYDPEIAKRWRAKGWPVTPLYTHPADQVADDLTMVKVSRELLEQIAVELEHDNDRYFLGRELRALLNGGRS